MKDLFQSQDQENRFTYNPDAPLADRMRPENLAGFVGQKHLMDEGKILRQVLEQDTLPSMIFWGPPGSGKTTLARIIAQKTQATFLPFSAVLSGIKEVKNVMARAQEAWRRNKNRTVVFIDEIHRFNRAQQDAFLPFVEDGSIILIGATTENPSFEVNGALLSRCKVLVLEALCVEDLKQVMQNALSDHEKGIVRTVKLAEGVLDLIANYSDGDARRALNTLEAAVRLTAPDQELNQAIVQEALQKKALLYDKAGEEHYNLISALHKSLRNSDADAALYWTVRMIEGGEDPLYILRRMIRFASEDIGLADPQALAITLQAKDAFDFIGPPEGHLALAQAAVYLALAPKSNAVYRAYGKAASDVQRFPAAPVPLHIRNAVTKLMQNVGYGKGYQYAHDYEAGVTAMPCLPEALQEHKYYQPTDRGLEKELKRRLEFVKQQREAILTKESANNRRKDPNKPTDSQNS